MMSCALIVIGGGSAGLTAVDLAVQLGARVALVDKDRIGGDCTWTGCVPSKTLIKVARVAHQMRTADRYGLPSTEPAVDQVSDAARSCGHCRGLCARDARCTARQGGRRLFGCPPLPRSAHHRRRREHVARALGSYQFTHYAGWQAFTAARNALLPGAAKGVADRVPWATFTDPEVAHAGLTEEQARTRLGDQVRTRQWPMDQVDRARTERDTAGFIKLVHTTDGTLLGATIVAGRAGEMIHEWIVALRHGMKVKAVPFCAYNNLGYREQVRCEQEAR